MSNYHNQIMNIQMPEDGRIKYNLDEQPDMTDVIAYKFGHRDARHAAAEIANEADRHIAELNAQLAAKDARIKELEIQFIAATGGERFAELEAQLEERML